MIEVFYIGQGDTLPYYNAQARDESGPLSLSAVTAVYFSMKNMSTGSVIMSAQAFVIDAGEGLVEYHWAAADTAVIGEYAATYTFVTPYGKFSLPRNTVAKVVVEDKYATG